MFKDFHAKPRPNSNGWEDRHNAEFAHPRTPTGGPVVHLIKGWVLYAESHKKRFDSLIGDDGVLGPAWETIGDELRTILNGECGPLDCGTVDGGILATMVKNGTNIDER